MSLVDVIIPTVEGREETLARCIRSYELHTARDAINLIVVKDKATCGEAWLEGMEQARSPYLHLTCDDLELISPVWLGACIEVADSGKLPCPIVRRPNGDLESCGGDMNAPACLISHLQPNGTEADFAPVPFGSREQAEDIGMIPAHYLSDAYWSHRGRQLGYSTVVTHGYEFVHHRSDVKRRGSSPDDDRAYAEAMSA